MSDVTKALGMTERQDQALLPAEDSKWLLSILS
jgi:hypothetical protein